MAAGISEKGRCPHCGQPYKARKCQCRRVRREIRAGIALIERLVRKDRRSQ
jgi:hypothetical protein